jgi:hypothetical protein
VAWGGSLTPRVAEKPLRSPEDLDIVKNYANIRTLEARVAERAKIVMTPIEGKPDAAIANELWLRPIRWECGVYDLSSMGLRAFSISPAQTVAKIRPDRDPNCHEKPRKLCNVNELCLQHTTGFITILI